MDKRIYKTQKAVFQAYLELLSKHEKFTIKDLCDTAGINKSTFYRNYKDIDDFQDKLIDKITDELLSKFENINYLYTEPKKFYEGLIQLLEDGCRFLNLNIYISKILPIIIKLFDKIKIYLEKKEVTNYNHNRALFVAGGILSFLERNGDILLLDALKDFRENLDLITSFTEALINYKK